MSNRTHSLWFRCAFAIGVFVATDAAILLMLAAVSEEDVFRLDHQPVATDIGHVHSDLFVVARGQVREDVFTVGILGGSVADELARFLDDEQETSPRLKALQQKVRRPVVFRNLAFPGGAQPVQLCLIEALAARIDLLVVVDGFNEIMERVRPTCAVVRRRCVRKGGCKPDDLAPFLDRVQEIKEGATDALGVFRYSGLYRVYLWALSRRGAKRFVDMAYEECTGSTTPELREAADPTEEWANCVALTHQSTTSRSTPALYFLQPNQWVKDSKTFSTEERATAFYDFTGEHRDVRPLYEGVDGLYAKYRKHIARMRKDGIPVHDLSWIYRDVKDPVYRDGCCHVNSLGNRLMADAIFEAVLESHVLDDGTG